MVSPDEAEDSPQYVNANSTAGSDGLNEPAYENYVFPGANT